MASFYSFHIQIWLSQGGLNDKSPNLHKKAKPWRIMVVVVKWRKRANQANWTVIWLLDDAWRAISGLFKILTYNRRQKS